MHNAVSIQHEFLTANNGYLFMFLKDISFESAEMKILLIAELVLISSIPQCNFLISLHVRVMDYFFFIDPFIITFLWNCFTLRKP